MKTFEEARLYCFTPGAFLKGRNPLDVVTAQIKGGADVIQLREKLMCKKDKLELGLKIREITRREGALFIVNDDVDLAMILDADGVHLGQNDIPIAYARPLMKEKIIGVSTHSLRQVKAASDAGADYIGVGPIFETSTKADREPLVGLTLLSEVTKICSIPCVAIGGINKENVASLVNVGCHRAAIISDIMLASNIEDRCKMLRRMLQ